MAELATVARPYAEALFKAVGATGAAAATLSQVAALSAVTADERLQQFAGDPKAEPAQVFDLITSVVGMPLDDAVRNFLRTVIDNGRLTALPEIAAQFQVLVHAQSGVSDAKVYSAFPIDDAQLLDVVQSLERRFGRKLEATLEIDPSLIGGVRVVVGDEVLDMSIKARLEQMKVALTA